MLTNTRKYCKANKNKTNQFDIFQTRHCQNYIVQCLWLYSVLFVIKLIFERKHDRTEWCRVNRFLKANVKAKFELILLNKILSLKIMLFPTNLS